MDTKHVKVDDFKVNNLKKAKREEEKRKAIVRINKDVMEILHQLGYDTYKNTDAYILAPTHHHSRKTIISNVSKGFHQYMKEISPNKEYKFKDLRKTQITEDAKVVGKEKASRRVHDRNFNTTEWSYFDDPALLPTADEKPTVFKGVALCEI